MVGVERAGQSVCGSCLCGEVEIRINLPTRWCVHCHCSMCRSAHGAAFVTWVGLVQDQFELTSGENHLTWYESSEGAFRGYCNGCGTPLLFRSHRWEDEIHVTLASLKDSIDRAPAAHVYFDHHVDWVELGDDLKRFPGVP